MSRFLWFTVYIATCILNDCIKIDKNTSYSYEEIRALKSSTIQHNLPQSNQTECLNLIFKVFSILTDIAMSYAAAVAIGRMLLN